MNKHFSLLCSFVLFLCTCVSAQSEILWTINMNTDQILQTDKRVFNALEKDLITFLNNQVWTEDRFEPEERIEATLFFTISEQTEKSAKGDGAQVAIPDAYKATVAIQSLRPVYNTGEKTPILNTLDKFVEFSYSQGEGIQYSDQNYLSDLGSVFAFYSYIILGLDYDSFSPLGGDAFFQKAQELYNRLPTNITNDTNNGWSANGKQRNRYFLLENITSPRMLPLRRAYYAYHRTGLDLMSQDLVAGRNNVTLAIEDAQKANQAYPQTVYAQAFVDAKRDEIIEIYKGATAVEQNAVIQSMSRLDPSKSSAYRSIRSRAVPGRATSRSTGRRQ
ncbi:DUF4835 family protein [Neolewinella aurantiaca]|uniref:DUF4835 family protein n=1 Tax=Neolewinella aurantiaca TaxID=2602767 RepID=A0A5C7FTC6_9BACT|nr:DUF4835 family protein [Neolewinella aurantiaca]TXF91391.1 DUF4835 family protein [Neolewinella aurantiaca]